MQQQHIEPRGQQLSKIDGEIEDECLIDHIGYHGVLGKIPVGAIKNFQEHDVVIPITVLILNRYGSSNEKLESKMMRIFWN